MSASPLDPPPKPWNVLLVDEEPKMLPVAEGAGDALNMDGDIEAEGFAEAKSGLLGCWPNMLAVLLLLVLLLLKTFPVDPKCAAEREGLASPKGKEGVLALDCPNGEAVDCPKVGVVPKVVEVGALLKEEELVLKDEKMAPEDWLFGTKGLGEPMSMLSELLLNFAKVEEESSLIEPKMFPEDAVLKDGNMDGAGVVGAVADCCVEPKEKAAVLGFCVCVVVEGVAVAEPNVKPASGPEPVAERLGLPFSFVGFVALPSNSSEVKEDDGPGLALSTLKPLKVGAGEVVVVFVVVAVAVGKRLVLGSLAGEAPKIKGALVVPVLAFVVDVIVAFASPKEIVLSDVGVAVVVALVVDAAEARKEKTGLDWPSVVRPVAAVVVSLFFSGVVSFFSDGAPKMRSLKRPTFVELVALGAAVIVAVVAAVGVVSLVAATINEPKEGIFKPVSPTPNEKVGLAGDVAAGRDGVKGVAAKEVAGWLSLAASVLSSERPVAGSVDAGSSCEGMSTTRGWLQD
jgi:hypothetical protein